MLICFNRFPVAFSSDIRRTLCRLSTALYIYPVYGEGDFGSIACFLKGNVVFLTRLFLGMEVHHGLVSANTKGKPSYNPFSKSKHQNILILS